MVDYKWQFAASPFFLENVICSKTLDVAYRTYQNLSQHGQENSALSYIPRLASMAALKQGIQSLGNRL